MKSSYGICRHRAEEGLRTCKSDARRREPRAQPPAVRYRQIEKFETRHPFAEPREVGVHPVGKARQPVGGVEPPCRCLDEPQRRVRCVVFRRPIEAFDGVLEAVAGAHELLGGCGERVRNAKQLICGLDRPRRRPPLGGDDGPMAGIDQQDRRTDGPPHPAERPPPGPARTPIHPARSARVDSGGGLFARARLRRIGCIRRVRWSRDMFVTSIKNTPPALSSNDL